MEMDTERFFEWYHGEASNTEKKLYDKITDYEDFLRICCFLQTA